MSCGDGTGLSAGRCDCTACGQPRVRDLANSTSLLRAMEAVASVTHPTLMPAVMAAKEGQRSSAAILAGKSSTDFQDTDRHHSAATRNDLPVPGVAGLPEIPGYLLERVIGRGGMGTVYLARQVSLDRPVALKVMSRKWTGDPTFVARFTREAFAAARLNHPNLVQVYDIGEAGGLRYFSMEYVDGRSLADVVRGSGRLDPETAVGYILQAARGLKHAHDRNMIHRDVKPDNLILDSQGLVKVADLGLVKAPHLERESFSDSADTAVVGRPARKLPSDMTGTRMALGTPAYMSPEQCRDAATVDHRSDIYSLGCTLYALVTGQQPFDGDTAVELMSKHAYTPPVPPEELAARVPPELSSAIQRMMAKRPDDRYRDMGEVIRVLEQWLGVHHAGCRLAAGEAQIAELESCVREFHHCRSVALRGKLVAATIATTLLAAVIFCFLGRIGWAFGLAGMILQAAAAYFVINGMSRGTHLYRRVRQFVRGFSIADWLIVFALIALFAILLWMLKLFWMWVGFGMIGAALAFVLRYALDAGVDAERHAPILRCERLLRRLRVQGLDEDQLRQFVAKYGGRHWEEFFEHLFGYETKMEARVRLLRGESAGHRERFAAWREPVLAVIDNFERSRRIHRERALLICVEEQRLRAEGFTRRAARRRAEHVVEQSLAFSATFSRGRPQSAATIPAHSTQQLALTAPGSALRRLPDFELGDIRLVEPATAAGTVAIIGRVLRGTAGAACVLACIAWAAQNRIFMFWTGTAVETAPLVVPGIAPEYTAWIDTANVGVAGLLLLTSLLYSGLVMSLLVATGAAVVLAAHHAGIPEVPPICDYHVGIMLGSVIALIGYRFGRTHGL